MSIRRLSDCLRKRSTQIAKALINLVVRANGFEQDGVCILVFDELKDDAQIVARAASPRAGQLAFQFVSLELRMKSVGDEQFERELKFRGGRRMFAGKTAGGTDKSGRWQQQAFHARILRMISEGVDGRIFPALNSLRAS